jgi:hypothetical protein
MTRKRLEKRAWFPVEGLPGLELCIRYLPVPEMSRLRQEALEMRRDQQTGLPVERVNEARFAQGLAQAIVDWRGLTRERYAQMLPIDPEDYPAEIPCEEEFKLELLLEARWFPSLVLELSTNLARYQQEQVAAELKN